MSAPTPFEVSDPLPIGSTTLIEASAGTGKTYALTALTTRLVVEHDVPIGRILVVTFTNAATAELKERIRQQLVDTERHLADPVETDDPILSAVTNGATGAERELRRERAAQAVRDFDTATVSTIHGFCSIVLSSLGVLADRNDEAVPAETDAELVRQVCADRYFMQASEGVVPGGESLEGLVKLVRKARSTPGCIVEAASGQPDEVELARLVRRCVEEVDARLTQTGGQSFDTLLTATLDALEAQPEIAEQVRRQFDAALIDEFQDTDPVQWAIFDLLFGAGSPESTMVLVGDPKQAIYSFRGGDVYTYLSAKQDANERSLATNQRSDHQAVQGMNALGAGEHFGETEIAFIEVEPAPRHQERRLIDSSGVTISGLEVRCLVNPDATDDGKLAAASVRRRIAGDLAARVQQLLTGAPDPDGVVSRALMPGDIAVLIGGKHEADPLVTELRRRNIPVVVRAGDSVVDSEAAEQWRTLLHALDRPADVRRALAASLGWFFGWSADQVVEAMSDDHGDADTSEAGTVALADLQHTLHEWAALLATDGMPALFAAARRSHHMLPRLLGAPMGERNLTDLEHLAELVHAEANGRRGLSPAAALGIIDNIDGADSGEQAADAVQRRIESDAAAVQIMTIHGSKGLEFPVVMLPGLWSGGKRVEAASPFAFHDRSREQRVLDVSNGKHTVEGPRGGIKDEPIPDFVPREETERQNCGDQHRLTYVAMTRAAHLSVVWWAPMTGRTHTNRAGLTRLLLGAGDLPANEDLDLGDPDGVIERIRERVAERGASDVVRVIEVTGSRAPVDRYVPAGDGGEAPELRVSQLEQAPRRDAHRWSFSQLSNASSGVLVHHGAADTTRDAADDRGAGDEPVGAVDETQPPALAPALDPSWSEPPLLEGLGGGTAFGNLVHEMFEHLDFTASDVEREIGDWLDTQHLFSISDEQRQRLPVELHRVLVTPLGPEFGDLTLGSLRPADRLNELTFYMPLAPGGAVAARAIGDVVADHLAADHALRGWAERLSLGLAPIRLHGFMSGSIDLTLRYDLNGTTRYSVVDYKTNRLTAPGADPVLADYHPDRLPAAMAHSNYPLQALIYSVVLHRYLTWRLPGYLPEQHLGAVGYLFVRGMCGPSTPRDAAGVPAGVFSWPLPDGLVPALSDLLAGLAPADAPPGQGGAS